MSDNLQRAIAAIRSGDKETGKRWISLLPPPAAATSLQSKALTNRERACLAWCKGVVLHKLVPPKALQEVVPLDNVAKDRLVHYPLS